VSKKTNKPILHTENNIEGFIKALATPHDEAWDEQVSAYEIRIDEHLATAWTPYKLYVGKKFTHQGVNAFQLARNEAGKWQIIQITDTRR